MMLFAGIAIGIFGTLSALAVWQVWFELNNCA